MTPTALGRNESLGCLWIARLSPRAPPTADALHCKLCGIMIDTHTNPTLIRTRIINPVRMRPTPFFVYKIIYLNFLWMTLRLPFPALVLQLTHYLFLLRVDGNDRLSTPLPPLHAPIDRVKLRIPIRNCPPVLYCSCTLSTIA